MISSNSLLDLMEVREIVKRVSKDESRRLVQKKIAKKKQRVLPIHQTIIFGEVEDE